MQWKRVGILSVAGIAFCLSLNTTFAEEKDKSGKKVITKTVVVRDGKVITRSGDDDDFFFDFEGGGGFLGVSTMSLNDELRRHFGAPADSGVLVSDVRAGSPAEKGGIKVGDVITGVEGAKVGGPLGIARALRARKSGDVVRIDYVRSGAAHQTSATLAERKAGFGFAFTMPDMEPLLALRTDPVRKEQLDKTMKKLDTYFNSPEWKAKVEKMSDCGTIQGRLQTMELRMRELEKKLNDR